MHDRSVLTHAHVNYESTTVVNMFPYASFNLFVSFQKQDSPRECKHEAA